MSEISETAGADEAPPMSHGDLLAEARRDLRESESELYKLQRRVGGLRKLIEGLAWLEAHQTDGADAVSTATCENPKRQGED